MTEAFTVTLVETLEAILEEQRQEIRDLHAISKAIANLCDDVRVLTSAVRDVERVMNT